jgi:anti-sigma regulatory factor (Ser/Thr protein kinase)
MVDDDDGAHDAIDEALDLAAVLRLPAEPASARRARHFIGQFCKASGLSADLCHTAALLVSELVTNAVIHGRTAATIEVHQPGDVLRVTVRDDNPDLPPIGDRPIVTAESGRGLMIVSMLAAEWGIERTDTGKAVWFALRVDA